MQTVFNNDMVAHVWAQQSQDQGKNGNGSLYFTGSTIFSYNSSFPIAKFVKPDLVLFTTNTYSTTTAQHCSKVRSAIHSAIVFNVPCVEIEHGTKHEYTKKQNKNFHAENVNHYKSEIKDAVLKAKRARTNKDFYNSLAFDLVCECNNYIDTFKLRLKYVVLPDADQILADAEKAKKAKIRKEKAAKARIIKENKAKIDRWLAGENIRLSYSIDTVFLRINEEKELVETSKGAQFPIKHAKLALKFIEKCREHKKEWLTNGKSINLGHFKIDKIFTNGDVKAGCHFVKYAEIKAISTQVKNFVSVEVAA